MWRKTRSKSANIVFRKIAEESLRSDRLARLNEDPVLDEALLETWRSKVRAHKTYVSCTGVDANRNFGYKWLSGGSSRNPCLDTYAGPSAFSEPETRALRDLVLDSRDSIAMYVSLHAYSQMWLLPWGNRAVRSDRLEPFHLFITQVSRRRSRTTTPSCTRWRKSEARHLRSRTASITSSAPFRICSTSLQVRH